MMNYISIQATAKRARRHTKRRAATVGLALLWLSVSSAVYATTAALESLAGRYVGVSIDDATTGVVLTPADTHLEVRAGRGRFIVRWQLLTDLDSGIRHYYEVAFEKTRRPGVYLAAMRCNVFGHPRPLDPALGEPFMWAYVGKHELTLYTMFIADNGTHDLSLYRYRREGDAITLEFRRVKDDRPVQQVRAVLQRTSAETQPLAPDNEQDIQRHRAASCG